MPATQLAHDDVHVFDPMGDGPSLFFLFYFFACFHGHSYSNIIYLVL